MFNFLAFLNLENSYLSSLFKFKLNEGELESEPLNSRFEEIDIFSCFEYRTFVWRVFVFVQIFSVRLFFLDDATLPQHVSSFKRRWSIRYMGNLDSPVSYDITATNIA